MNFTRNHWRRQITLEDAQRWEVARIFHFVNKLDWSLAREHARNCTASELETVIRTHPNWEKEQPCSESFTSR